MQIIGLSFMLMSPIASLLHHETLVLWTFLFLYKKDLNETCLLQESFAVNFLLQHSNIKPPGKSKMQLPQTDAQKKKVPFNLLHKVMTN